MTTINFLLFFVMRFFIISFRLVLDNDVTFSIFFDGILKKQAIILDCHSNPNQSQICDWQSRSKSDFQNGLTIQSKSNHNPTIFLKKDMGYNNEMVKFYYKTKEFPRVISFQLTTLQINIFLKFLIIIACLHCWSIMHYEILVFW
jgi:hypothetical protein